MNRPEEHEFSSWLEYAEALDKYINYLEGEYGILDCPNCGGEGEVYTVMGFSRCKVCKGKG